MEPIDAAYAAFEALKRESEGYLNSVETETYTCSVTGGSGRIWPHSL